MIRIRAIAERAAESQARADYRAGYSHGINGMNPPNPDDLSEAYWRGYSRGSHDAHACADFYPDSHEAKGF